MVKQTLVKMTAAEFKQLPETNNLTELINGEIIMSPSPKDPHQSVIVELTFILKRDAAQGKTRVAPSDLYLDDLNVVQPDVFWFAPENPVKLVDGYLHGIPDLIVEVLSPGTSRRDRGEKFDLYQKHGVPKYWLIDTVDEFVEVYKLENGKFARQDIYEPGEYFHSTVLNQDVKVSEIFGGE